MALAVSSFIDKPPAGNREIETADRMEKDASGIESIRKEGIPT
jgi:hypothetical protein